MSATEEHQPTDGERIQLANLLILLKGKPEIEVDYKNHRGETSRRRIVPVAFWCGSTEWHPETGLLLNAYDDDKGAMRDFAVMDFDLSTLQLATPKQPVT